VDNVRAAPNAGGVGHRLNNFIEELLRYYGIGVNENQDIAVRAPSANVSNPCYFVDLFVRDCCAKSPRDIRSVIRARVIDNDQFHAAPARSNSILNAGQRFGEVPFFVESGNDDA
jgi:hypothetical protein